MRARDDRTSMGGENDSFPKTNWSAIRNAKTIDAARRREIVDSLARDYWKPIYCYIWRKGYDNELAKDLTQGFFEDIVIEKGLIQKADQSRGRFRTFLLTALGHYLISSHRKKGAQKRSPERWLDNVDDLEFVSATVNDVCPEQAFNYAWAADILDKVISKVKQDCLNGGKEIHWKVFEARVLNPIINNTQSPPLSEICDRFGVESESKASNMIVTVTRKFQVALKNFLRPYLESDSDIEEEIGELMEILSKGIAG